MLKRKLGIKGPEVSMLGLGCMSMSDSYEPDRKDEESIRLIRHAYAQGVNFFDTAAVYGADRHNEKLVGTALKDIIAESRDNVFIATKCGVKTDWSLDSDPESIKASCRESLRALGISYIDLFYLHRLPATDAELAKCLDAFMGLLDEGLIHYVGLSEASAGSIRFTHQYLKEKGYADKFIAVQTELNLLTQDVKHNGVLQACDELGIGFVSYSPLSRALLAPPEKLNKDTEFEGGDVRSFFPRFQGENFAANLVVRDQLLEVAREKSCTLPQLALAWVSAQGKFVVPIPGTRKIAHLEDNLAATGIHLTAADVARADGIAKEGGKGLRYPEDVLKMHNIAFEP
ncbi:MAG: aldo/keto reductase [Gammaproteobacteria bacterium]|jgi:aryl-alcohol dehydrogenase-like predicted oxidoreductase|nr:aldo/keto reductase [Gammaproteobacteria bacterium]